MLVGFLPPLLYAAAIRSSIIDFRTNWRPIGYLSILLVMVTALGIGWITWLILPVPFALAFAFGAVVAPPDAVAATTIARRSACRADSSPSWRASRSSTTRPRSPACASGLVALATHVTAGDIAAGFVIAAVGGVVVGFVVAALATAVRKQINKPVFDTAISFMVPWAAYLPAEAIGWGEFHGSGVIAVVVAGLILGHKSPLIQSGLSRLSERGQLDDHPVPAREHRVPADRSAGPPARAEPRP